MNHKLPGIVVTDLPRTETIGSTDARVIAAGTDWLSLYREKVGEAQRADLSHVWKPRLGIETEPLHAWWHSITEKERVIDPYRDQRLTRADLPPHHTTSIDRIVITDQRLEILEMKHTNERNNLRDAAEYYMAQLQWQLHVTDQPGLRFSIIRGNNEPEWGWVARDAGYIARLVAQVDAFWWHVSEGVPPDPSPTEGKAERAALARTARAVPINGFKPYDMKGSNEWADAAADFIRDRKAAANLKKSEPRIRGLIPADASLVTGAGLTFKRDARGAYRVTIEGEDD